MLKKLAVSAAVLISIVAGAATILEVEKVNKAVAEILAPFNNNTTTAKVEFLFLDIADDLTQRFGGTLGFSKVGSQNELTFNINKLDYQYKGTDGLPTVEAAADLKLDLVKAIGQKELNEIAASAEELVIEFAAEMAKEYGEAVTTQAGIDAYEKDEAGNVVRLKIHVSAVIDLAKLPETIPSKDVAVTVGSGTLDINLAGAELNLKVGLNPDYKGFASDQKGMKEYIEGLLAENKEVYEELGGLMGWIDQIATSVVEEKAEEPKP